MKGLSLEKITKFHQGRKVLNNLDLNINSGEIFVLLGPSGSGKTSLLRIISGLDSPDSGSIFLDEKEITQVPSNKRKINTVFQQQALFPHMNVYDNIEFGLKIRNVCSERARKKIKLFLSLTNLLGLEKKFPNELSGGQKQRVALARAMVVDPKIILFDEPMSALDSRLKKRLLAECIEIQRQIKTTFIYVTHDHEEAMNIADRIGIMGFDGNIEQIGTPEEVYNYPKSKFIADFMGSNALLKCEVESIDNDNKQMVLKIEDLEERIVASTKKIFFELKLSKELLATLKPESIHLCEKKHKGNNTLDSEEILSYMYSGKYTQYNIKLKNNQTLTTLSINHNLAKSKKPVFANFRPEDLIIFEK